MSKYKYLVLSDLDGTLLNSKGELSCETIKYVQELNKRDDILFSFSTGRGWKDASKVYEDLDLKGFVSCCNGALIYNPHTNISFYSFLSQRIWEGILENESYLKGVKDIDFMSDKGCFFLSDKNPKDVLEDMKKQEVNVFCIKCYFHRSNSEKALSNKEIIEKLLFLKSFKCKPSVTIFDHSESLNLELQASYVSKEKTVEIMGALYGIPSENILTFGDQVNDLSAALGSSRFMAVSNAINLIKEKAPRISFFSNDEDAVVKEIDLFLKEEGTIK